MSMLKTIPLHTLAAVVLAVPALAQDPSPTATRPPEMRSGVVEEDAGQAAQPRGLTEEGKLRQPLGAEPWEDVEETTNPGETPGRDDIKAGEGPQALPPGPVQSVVRPEPLEPATPPTMPEPRSFEGERQPPAKPLQDSLSAEGRQEEAAQPAIVGGEDTDGGG